MTASRPWQDPSRPEGQTCPLCKAPPGSLCRRANGQDVMGGWHERRIRAAEGQGKRAKAEDRKP